MLQGHLEQLKWHHKRCLQSRGILYKCINLIINQLVPTWEFSSALQLHFFATTVVSFDGLTENQFTLVLEQIFLIQR